MNFLSFIVDITDIEKINKMNKIDEINEIKFTVEEVEYELVVDKYRGKTSIIRTEPFCSMVIPREYAERLCLFTTEKISAFLEAHIKELVQFNESIIHEWSPNCRCYCLDPDCAAMYFEDQRVIEFFEQWLTGLRARVKSARS